jgi:prevent-host-death family protein
MRTELVATLKRKAAELIGDLQEPILITQDGRPAAYLVDVRGYEALQQRVSILEGIARGERAIKEGRIVSHASAKKRMARWLS